MIGSGPGRGTKRSVSCSPFATEFKAKRTATNLRRNNFACLFSVRKLTRAYNRVATEKAGALSRCGGRERAAETAEREEEKERQRGQKREKGKNGQRSARTACTPWGRVHPRWFHSPANRAGRLLDLLCLNYHTEPLLNSRPSYPPTGLVRFVEKHSVAKVYTLSARLRATRVHALQHVRLPTEEQMRTHARVVVEVGLRLT